MTTLSAMNHVPPACAQYALAGTLAALAGAAELVTRYRDNPRRLAGMVSFHAYWLGNASAGLLALLVVRHAHLKYGTSSTELDWLAQVLLAAFGSLLVLRSSIVTVETPDGKSIQAGPGAAVSAVLEFIDGVIDRNQARRLARTRWQSS